MVHVAALMPPGGAGALSGRTMPQSPIRGPPTGSSGIGRGSGLGSPGFGSSDVSMGAGGSWRAWQAPRCSWLRLGLAGGPRPADAPGAATTAAMTRAHSDTTNAGTNLAVA